jgi:toxin ParE1/3/4
MGSYKLSKKARADMKRIWLYGVKTQGIQRADQYHQGMPDRFAQIAEQPNLYQAGLYPCKV